jgi:DNA replication protein DnaC
MDQFNHQPGDIGKTRESACATHGSYQSHNILGRVWSKCPACTAEQNAIKKAERAETERLEHQNRWRQKIDESCIPPRFTDRTLESFVADTDEKRRALAFATRYAEEFDDILATGRSALFLGKPGTGKTHLASAIGLMVMEGGYSVLFMTVMRAIRRVKDTWSRNAAETEGDAVAALVIPDLLILDEVGVQFGSDTEKMILFDVLNQRYERRQPTIFLSNCDNQDVESYLGERIFDRLREDGSEVVSFGWESHRRRPLLPE